MMYELLPFCFKRYKDKYLLSNMIRNFIYISSDEFEALCNGILQGEIADVLREKGFIAVNQNDIENVSMVYRKINAGLFRSTYLHIFVLTLECNLNCQYCQAAHNKPIASIMGQDVAKKAVDIALQSPSDTLTFEFQGGEPLLKFDTLKFIVEYSKSKAPNKKINYSLVTNTEAMTDEILSYLIDNDISICVSLDGPKYIHDINRPTKAGGSNFDNVMYWFNKALEVYKLKNKHVKISALPTITRQSLPYAKEIIDLYIDMGIKYISIREISPFGRASVNWDKISYSYSEFNQFYRECMDYIVQQNIAGKTNIRESMTEMLLQEIILKSAVSYTDLRSPCGAAIGQIAYNWDGKIYTCDEGRMLSNSGCDNFLIGDVFKDTLKSCLETETVCEICSASCIDCNPNCRHCVFYPICGICPVYNYYMQNDYVGSPILQDRCKMLQGRYEYIIDWINTCDTKRKNVIESWLREE